MSIQPVVGLPGVYPPKLSVRREIFLHPDRVSYRYSGRFLHKHAKDWEDLEAPNTLKAGTLLALIRTRFPGESQQKRYWFPFVLTASHLSTTNKILLPEGFKRYAHIFGVGSRFTRIATNINGTFSYSTVTATSNPVPSGSYLEIPCANQVDDEWADNSVLVYWGLDGPFADQNPFEYVLAFSILPGDTLVSDTHTQLHHYPWSGIVKGSMLYPRNTSNNSSGRNRTLERVVRGAAASGLTGLLVDEIQY